MSTINTNITNFAQLTKAMLAGAPPPTEAGPIDDVQLSPQASPEQRQAQAVKQFATCLSDQLADGIQGWEVYHVDKASFPFQVDKQARLGQEKANLSISSNQKHADRTLVRDNRLRSELRNALMDAGVASPEVSTEDVKTLLDFFGSRVQNKANFYYQGTLCTVGWGRGDQEAARGYPPNGPKTTIEILMNGADAKVLEVIKHYIS